MSQMLKQAIVDANALKEQALKNAEAKVIEHYSPKIREAVNLMLEQDELEDDELDLGGMNDLGAQGGTPLESDTVGDLPMAATDGETLCSCPEDEEEIEIDFNDLEQQMAAGDDALGAGDMIDREEYADELEDDELAGLMEELEKMAEEDLDEDHQLDETPNTRRHRETDRDADRKQGRMPSSPGAIAEVDDLDEFDDTVDETTRLSPDEDEMSLEEMIDALDEELEVDTSVAGDGWLGTNNAELDRASDQALAQRASTADRDRRDRDDPEVTNLRENLKTAKTKIKSLETSKNKLIEENQRFKQLLKQYKGKLIESNLNRAKLHYTNRILVSDSLNERQKDKIVEAIAETKSVEKAKVIYETLQHVVGSKQKNKHAPQSLHEAGRRGPVANVLSSREEPKHEDSTKRRLMKLAGITPQ